MVPTDKVIAFITDAAWQDLPPVVRRQAKRCLLDGLGAMVAGGPTPVGRLMAGFAEAQMAGAEATVLASGRTATAAGAALANGFAANALDIDDGHRRVKGHPGACVLPVLLAAAEAVDGVSGTEFLTTLVVGYEIGICAGLIRHATQGTYHASGSWGAVAGAAAGGRLYGLDADRLRHAMGAAEYHAPMSPMMKGIATPSMGKDAIGWGCLVAMLSLDMAREGFTGIRPLFDDAPEPRWIDRLGRDYEMRNLYFKPYACCRWAQPAVVGAVKVVRGAGLRLSQIRAIRVRTFEAATRLPDTPPRNTEEAQYHLAFPVAAALHDGDCGPRQVLAPRIFDRRLLALASCVTVEADEALEACFPQKACARVVVETGDGRRYDSGVVEAPWEPPDDRPDDRALEAKFRRLTVPVLGEETAGRLVARIWDLDQTADVRRLVGLCAPLAG